MTLPTLTLTVLQLMKIVKCKRNRKRKGKCSPAKCEVTLFWKRDPKGHIIELRTCEHFLLMDLMHICKLTLIQELWFLN